MHNEKCETFIGLGRGSSATVGHVLIEIVRVFDWIGLCEIAANMESKEIAERCLRFAVRIVNLHERMVRLGGATRALAPQLLRSGTSIGANLEEATAGQTKPDFITKVSIARKEARETVYWLRLLIAAGLLTSSEIEWELNEATQ